MIIVAKLYDIHTSDFTVKCYTCCYLQMLNLVYSAVIKLMQLANIIQSALLMPTLYNQSSTCTIYKAILTGTA